MGLEPGAVGSVIAAQQLAGLVDAREQVTAVIRHEGVDRDPAGAAIHRNQHDEFLDPAPVWAERRWRASCPQDPVDHLGVGDIGLVDDDDLFDIRSIDVSEHRSYGADLALGSGRPSTTCSSSRSASATSSEGRAEGVDQVRGQRRRSPPCRSGELRPSDVCAPDRTVVSGWRRAGSRRARRPVSRLSRRTCRRWCSRRWRRSACRWPLRSGAWCRDASSSRSTSPATWRFAS